MRRVLFIIAFVILANPLLSNIDIVPDFLAYILIMIALSKSTYIEAKANGAFKGARNMLIVSIGRLAATYFTVMSIDDVLSLVFSFVFFILEMVLGVSFLLKLFDYFYSLAYKTENTSLLTYISRIKIVTIVILALRLLLSTLPDFILLTRNYELISTGPDYSGLRYVLMGLSFILFIPAWVAWIVLESKLTFRLFTRSVETEIVNEFNEKIENKQLHYEIKSHQRMILFVSLSMIFTFFVRKDGINVFYNSTILVIFICYYFALCIKKQIRLNKHAFILTGVSALQLVARIAETKLLNKYFVSENYTLSNVFNNSGAETLYYYEIMPVVWTQTILFIIGMSLMVYLMVKSSYESLVKNFPLVYEAQDNQFNYKDFKRRVIPSAIVTTSLSFLSITLYPTVISYMPYIDELVKIGYFKVPLYSWALPLFTVLTAVFVASFIVMVVLINENSYKRVYNKISLD